MADNKNKKRQRAALMTVLNKLMDGDDESSGISERHCERKI